MSFSRKEPEELEVTGRVWRFAAFEFDESSRLLRSADGTVDLESKPLDILYQLLLHAGEVVTKDELFETVWPGTAVVDGSLTTAISKLRKALADDNQSIVVTIPRIGYKLGVPASAKRVAAPSPPELGFQVGDFIPGRPQWVMTRNLDVSFSSEVWLAEHPKTREKRVFKFASDGIRLRGLKREVTLARLLLESLGERPDFVRVLEWNFDTAPYFLESEYGGLNLADWVESRGGLPSIPLAERIQLLAAVARAVAAAHSIGVLHKDLKPANILIDQIDGAPQVKVADFGSGVLLHPDRLAELNITNMGFTLGEGADGNPMTGTLMYMSPEVLRGDSPTASADVYALGVILYQMIAGDFRKPLSPGWESDIADPLLRDDIASAACGDPARRLSTAGAVAERLETLESRRAAQDELVLARQRAADAERRLARARARRPWAIAAILALSLGLGASLYLYRSAERQREIAAAANRFLANDLLGRGNPFQSGKSAETLAEAVRQASPDIDRQFANAPEVAAMLHHSIAKALDTRSEYPGARQEYEKAAALYRPDSGERVVVELQRAAMEARTYSEGSLAKAKTILAEQEPKIAGLRSAPDDLPVWLASARGMIALIGNDAAKAAAEFQTAYDRSLRLPAFDEMARLTFKQRMAFAHVRLGDGARAEQLFRELIDAFTRLRGPDNPSVLRVRLNLAQAFMIQNKHKESVAETTAIYPAYVARLGEDHELAMQVLTTRAQSEGALGMWTEAIRDDLKIHELAVKKQGPLAFFSIATLSDAALAQCRAGSSAEGERNARQAYDNSAKAFGPRAGLTGGTAYTLASCWIGQRKLDDARRLLRDIDIPAVAQLAGVKDWGANVDLALAQIALRKGEKDEARKLLAAASPAFVKPDAEPYQRHALEDLQKALSSK